MRLIEAGQQKSEELAQAVRAMTEQWEIDMLVADVDDDIILKAMDPTAGVLRCITNVMKYDITAWTDDAFEELTILQGVRSIAQTGALSCIVIAIEDNVWNRERLAQILRGQGTCVCASWRCVA